MNEKNQSSQEISLIEIFYELKKKKYVLLLFILIALIGVVAYKILIPKKYTYESSFTFLVAKNDNQRSSLLGNSSVLKNDNLYLDINIADENNTINVFKTISPNSYEDILNADSALLYFAKLPLPYSTHSVLDSLKEKNKNKSMDTEGELNPDILLLKKHFNNKTFTSKYNHEKNIVVISVTTKNKAISKWWSLQSIVYLTKYIQNIQNQKIQDQFLAIEKAIQENKIFNDQKADNKKLSETIEKILTKQLYEYRLQSSLIDTTPFNTISTKNIPEKLSTSLLFIIAIIVGAIVGGLWIFAQKMWVNENQNLTKK